MSKMNRDKLDELLKCALSGKDDARDAASLGLQRLRRRLAENAGDTVLDALLAKALAPADAASRAAVADAGLRRLRQNIGLRPVRRWAPVLRPALAFATIAVIAALLLIINPFAKFNPVETVAPEPSGFEGAFIARNEIVADLPKAIVEPLPENIPPKAIVQERPKASLHADAMDAFASKVRGESYAKRVTAHRRAIIASLTNDKEKWETSEDNHPTSNS